MSLENELREALRRVRAPEGFAERVRTVILSRADDEGSQPRRTWWRAVAATLLLGAIVGGWGAHETMQRREGERAREQVLLALRIAGTQVARAQHEARDHMAR